MSVGRRARMDVLIERHRRRCVYCNRVVRRLRKRFGPWPRDMATEDHIIPKSAGGGDDMGNLVLACIECNNERGDMPAADYMRRKHEERLK